jgi:deazaflavin-dependent oxidoreductase (nitroreductase family)
MKLAPVITRADRRLHGLSKGRFSLLAMAGLPSLRLTTTGRKSGLPRSVHLLFLPRGDEFVLTGSNWGRAVDPGWAFNLRANPAATVAVRGREVAVSARQLEGAEYADVWRALLEFWPGYAMEQAAARRELPIFVLTPATR